MAGIGVQLNRIFNKNTVTTSIYGIGFSFTYTIAPMLSIIGCLLAMYKVLGFDSVGFTERELFSCSVLYIFIFSMLTSSPFNSVLSKYQTDKIYEQKYEDIRPCIIVGTITNLTFSSLIAIPFCIRAVLKGIPIYYMFTVYMGYLGFCLTLSTMVYNSILKQYKKMCAYFVISMGLTFVLSLIFKHIFNFSITYSMLLALTVGFLLIASLELANVLRFFTTNSNNYRDILHYYRIYWKLIAANFLYTLGLFSHNFVFWMQPWRLVVFDTYVCNQPYDMASFLAMFTNISAGVFFISRVEMHFHEKYKNYMEAIIGGKLDTIEKTKKRMFQVLSSQLITLAHFQFIITVIIYLIAVTVLPTIGFSGLVMEIYPLLTVGYYITFIMYSELLFLYYFNDLTGGMINGLLFTVFSVIGSLFSANFNPLWYGAGFTVAGFISFTYSYFRLRWIEKNIDIHVFCRGTIVERVNQKMPRQDVYNIYDTGKIDTRAG